MSVRSDLAKTHFRVSDTLTVGNRLICPNIQTNNLETKQESIESDTATIQSATIESFTSSAANITTAIIPIVTTNNMVFPDTSADVIIVTPNPLPLPTDAPAVPASNESGPLSPPVLREQRRIQIPTVSTNANFVLTEGAQSINGILTFVNGILLATSGGTASNFNYYEEFQGTLTFTSSLFTDATVGYRIIRIGGIVLLSITTGFSKATTGSDGIMTSLAIPTRFWPQGLSRTTVSVINNSVSTLGMASITPSGTITLHRCDFTTGNVLSDFVATGNAGCSPFTMFWFV